MELRHLRYFVGVGEEEHFGRAAERLGVAQPALSRQIRDLENELGFVLFDRLARGVKLSSAGKLYLSDARRILQDVQEAKRRAERVATGKTGTLRVGFGETQSWQGVVPDSFRQFRKQNPGAELELYPMAGSPLIEAIQSGKLDAAFAFSLTELNALMTFAPGARSATISLEVRPEMSPRRIGLRLANRLVASTRTRPFQSGIAASADCTAGHPTASTTMSWSVTCSAVPAEAPSPSSFTRGVSESGPRVLLIMTWCPKRDTCFAMVWARMPAPRMPIFM
jgi:DNA-binding transcriptional LysR family regulator